MAGKFGEFGSVMGGEAPRWEEEGLPEGPDAVDPVRPGTSNVASTRAAGVGGGLVGSNGGSYGVNGLGLGPDLRYTAGAFAEGGGVLPMNDDDEDDLMEPVGDLQPAGQGPASGGDLQSSLDLVRKLFQNTRQQFGIPSGEVSPASPPIQRFVDGGDVTNPASAHKVSEAGGVIEFDEGGEVPEDDQEQGQQPNGLLAYGAGAGAVSPEVAKAIEQRVDPQGAMDPNERVVRALAAAGQAGPGLLQHYRQKYNALQAFAKAALTGTQNKPGDPMASARAATQMMQYVPDGKAYDFHPTRAGMAMRTRSVGGKPVQSFATGGAVESADEDEYANARTGLFSAEHPEDVQPPATANRFQALEPHPDDEANKFPLNRALNWMKPGLGTRLAGGEVIQSPDVPPGIGDGQTQVLPWDQYKNFLTKLYDWWADQTAPVRGGKGIFSGGGEQAAAAPPPTAAPAVPPQQDKSIFAIPPGSTNVGVLPTGEEPEAAPARRPRAPAGEDVNARFERTGSGWRKLKAGEEPAIPDDLMRQAYQIFPRGTLENDTARSKWISSQLAGREKYASAERVAETTAESREAAARDRGVGAAEKRWGPEGGEIGKAKIRSDADKYKADQGRASKDFATSAKFVTEYENIIAKMQNANGAALAKMINSIATTPDATGKVPSEDAVKQTLLRRAAALQAAAKVGVPLPKAIEALRYLREQAATETAEPEATPAAGGLPTFSSPAEVQAAIKSGQLKKGMKFRTSDGRIKQVP